MSQKKRAVFFDRDNTLIVDKVYLNDPEQIVYLPGAFESLRKIRDSGFHIIVVTNQSGVAKGLVQLKNLWEIHRRIRADYAREGIDIHGFYYAPFSVSSNHPMRKPNPGMLLEAAFDHGIDLSQSWMVGDRASDVEAGHRAGTKSIFLHGTEEPPADLAPHWIAENLMRAAEIILKNG